MNDAWKRIFNDWIKSYQSIEHLENQGVLAEFKADSAREQLLEDIINTCISEVEE